MNVIEAKGLKKAYGSRQVLKDINFSIEDKKITGLIGRNGVGKTTLLKIISGFIRETAGEIRVFSKHPFNNLSVSANSIMIDDQMVFPSSLTLAELIEMGERFYTNFDKKLAYQLMDYFSLPLNQYHHRLSKGMKSTFNMIFGLSSHCALTIYDEPTTGMDAAVRKDFYRALLRDYVAHPRSIIISSHHLNEIEDLLEEVLLIHDGKVRLHQPIEDLKEYALAFQGKKETIDRVSEGQEVLYEKEMAPGFHHVVLRNTFSQKEVADFRHQGVEITPVSANDLCIYLTNRHKGGIDDVFRRSESV